MVKTSYWFRFHADTVNGRKSGWVRCIVNSYLDDFDADLEEIIAYLDAEEKMEQRFGRDFWFDDNKVVVY